MKIRNVRDLGLLLRQERQRRGWSQADLAHRIGASRHWVIEMERGKPTVELALVLKAISALNLICDVRESGPGDGPRPPSGTSAVCEPPAPIVNLAGVLSSARGRRLTPPKSRSTPERATGFEAAQTGTEKTPNKRGPQ
jgi:y4mF family transcriptional regulator